MEIKSLLFGTAQLTDDKAPVASMARVRSRALRGNEEARVAVVDQMSDLLRQEFRAKAQHWNDGKRARDLIGRIISDEGNFVAPFWDEGFSAVTSS